MSVFHYDVSGISAPVVDQRSVVPVRLPGLDRLEQWTAALRATPSALSWLRQRGLSDEAIEYWKLGYDGAGRAAITIPLVEDGILYNVKRRFLDGQEPKYRALGGRRLGLYPTLPEGEAVLLCEGEFDALIARQHGLPAVTGTAGVRGWPSPWSRAFAGKRVAICLDAGRACFAIATERARKLVEAGAKEAWPADLGRAGLRDGEDLTDWFVTYRHSPMALRDFINLSRRRAIRSAA